MLKIDGYEIVDELGAGGMASVYKAIQHPLDRLVALKVLSPHLFTASPQFGERFERETKILAKFAHTGIVRVYDAGRQGDYYYLAMEMLEGGTLTERFKNKKISGVRDTLIVIQKLAQALEHSHEKQIIHRDIKPDNILFRSEQSNEPVLADYGIAKSIDNSDSLTVDASIIGSPSYMSPEQTLGQAITPKTDVFSLGVVFFQAVMGRLPFPSSNIGELALAHRDGLKDETFEDQELKACQKLWLKMLKINAEQRISAKDLDRLIETELRSMAQQPSANDATVIRPVADLAQSHSRVVSNNEPIATNSLQPHNKQRKPVRHMRPVLLASLMVIFGATGAYFYYIKDAADKNVFQENNLLVCCSIEQLNRSVKTKSPEYIEFFIPQAGGVNFSENGQYSGQWAARAAGYQQEVFTTSINTLPTEVNLKWVNFFSPEAFYDYQSLLAGNIQSPNDFILKHPNSMFVPIAALLATPTSEQLNVIEKYAERNDPVAQFQLSEIYDNGLATANKDTKKALKWAKASAAQGYLPARMQLFVFAVQSGDLQPGSHAYDAELKALADQNFWLAQYLYAMYKRQLMGDSKVSQWLPFLEQAATAGDFKSHQALSEIYASEKYSDKQLATTKQLRYDKTALHKRAANQLTSRLLQ